jgi:transposase
MILDLARSGRSDRQIAAQLQLSCFTVRKWRRRGQHAGLAALGSPMGRPAKGALSTYPPEVVASVRQWRQDHPGWGPLTLRTELSLRYGDQRLPSTASITRWLRQEGLTRRYERHQPLPNTGPPAAATACHETWQMDARGQEMIPDVGVVSLIVVNDVFSRAKIASYPCWLGAQRASRHADTEDYQVVLRLAFSEWGLPDRLAVDHDSVFYDTRSKSPFPTRLHLWLIALGVSLTFARFGRPTDQAITERSHQTWDWQALQGQTFARQESFVQALADRRRFLNEHLSCASLGDQPPLVAHPEAQTPRRRYRPEWEADLLNTAAVHAYLATGRWFRKATKDGAVSLGGSVYHLAHAWRRTEVMVVFDPADQHFVFTTVGQESIRLSPRHLTSQDLMGEAGACHNLHQFQLALPLSWEAWRSSFTSCLACGTT